MPLFKPSSLAKLAQFFPCLLCSEARAVQHGVCLACWTNLPWRKQLITRHDINCYVACSYEFPMDRLIHHYKDRHELYYTKLLAACLLEMPKPKIQAIVPMPMSTERLIERGFSHIERLAQILSETWQVAVWQPVQRHEGLAQRGLDQYERLSNLTEQFYIKRPEHDQSVEQHRFKHVLILDDVITTGASLAALKQQLQLLGCSHIYALCLCDARV